VRTRRQPGPLEVSAAVRAALARLLVVERVLEGRPMALGPCAPLPLEAVETLEEHLRARLSDDALAVFAAEAGALEGFSLGQVGARSEEAWARGLSKARVVLGVHAGLGVCAPRRPVPGQPLRVSFFDPVHRTEGDVRPLAAWLEHLVEVVLEGVELDEATLEAIEACLEAPRFEPGLAPVLEAPVLEAPVVPWVRHARFGEGRVLRARPGTDQLEIDFGPHGIRVLVARFVAPCPAPSSK